MQKSGRSWLVPAFAIVTLIGLLLPVGGYPAGLLILLVGAVAAVALKRRGSRSNMRGYSLPVVVASLVVALLVIGAITGGVFLILGFIMSEGWR